MQATMASLSKYFFYSIPLILLSSSSSFAPLNAPTRYSTIEIRLVPSQAKDLEACAYDLMKEAANSTAKKDASIRLSKDINAKLAMEDPEHQSAGPVGWCRQKLFGKGEKKDMKLP